MSEIVQWYNEIPMITRHWFGLSVLLPLLGRIGIVSPYWCILTPDYLSKFELWRPITSLFYYPISSRTGIHYLMNLYFLYNYSKQLETGHFAMKPADYFWCLIFNWFATLLIATFMNVMLLMDPMVLSVIYVWCQLNRDTIVTFWFGTRFRAVMLPWVLLGFNVLINGGGLDEIIGIVVGHMYYFATIQYPAEHGGAPLLKTPSFIENLCFLQPYQNTRNTAGFTYIPPNRDNQAASDNSRSTGSSFFRGHSWGQGRRLDS